jgi:hypothetical protein
MYVFTRPSEETFGILLSDPFAGTNRALIWVALGSLISAALTTVFNLNTYQTTVQGMLGDTAVSRQFAGTLITLICGIPFITIAAIAGFSIYSGLVHFTAGALGGDGQFSDLFYLFAAITAPVSIVTALLGAIPIVGCLNLPVAAYSLYLQVLAVKTVHRLDWPRAAASVFVLVILVSLALCVLLFVIGAPIVGALIPRGS